MNENNTFTPTPCRIVGELRIVLADFHFLVVASLIMVQSLIAFNRVKL